MRKDTAIYILRELINKFPENVRDNISFAGGCVRDLRLNEKVKDYDLFTANKETEQLVIKFLSNDGDPFMGNEFDGYKVNENEFLANFMFEGKFVQVIKNRHYDLSTTELIDSFDFTITCAMVTSKNVFFHSDYFEHVLTKRLAINKITFPLSTLERLQKYVKRGYTACNGTLLSIARSLSGVPISDDPEENKNNSLIFYPDGTPRFMGID